MARITGKAKSHLPRDLKTVAGKTVAGKTVAGKTVAGKTVAGYGLMRLERGDRGRITPRVTNDRVELDLPLSWSRKIS